MINHKISVDWSTTKAIAQICCTPRVQEVYTKSEIVHSTPGQLGLGLISRFLLSLVHHVYKKYLPCTPRLQEIHTESEVVHPTPGFGVIFNTHP